MDALVETAALVPVLALAYFLVGLFEYRYGDHMGPFITRLGIMGPVMGALVGCVPQCGFSVLASALYVKRLISVGTLLAVFLSTSDEAVPVLLSMPGMAPLVGLLIAVKLVIAVAAGIAIDVVIRTRRAGKAQEAASGSGAAAGTMHEHAGCCDHELSGDRSKLKMLVLHPLKHTAKVLVFLFVLTALMNFAVARTGTERIAAILLRGTVFQPVLASLVGLIPNCFTSVLLVELFAKGAIGFGSMVAGLCAGCGLGLLVLVKEDKDRKDTLFVIGLLLAVSIAAGLVVSAPNIKILTTGV